MVSHAHTKKARIRTYHTETISDLDCADGLVLLVNTPAQAESLHHSPEQATRSIGFYVNTDKTEFMCFKQDGATLNSKTLTISYISITISLTESNVDTYIGNAWTATDRLLAIWKYDLSDRIKQEFFKAVVVSVLLCGCTTWTLSEAACCFE